MIIRIFCGPTISAAEGREEIDAVFLPPAAQGDVYRAALDRPTAIGIIDGYFERIPSVSHKEILWAMAQGVHVFGAASMGALRAAELALFGMEGVGAIYDAYARGEIEADDEVAVAHASEEHGHRSSSEALVNIRATLRAAEQAGAIPAATREQLERVAKGLFYPDRCYPILLACAAKEGVPPGELEALQAFLRRGRIDQKRLDALALLRLLRERFADGAEPRRVRYHFEATDAWEHIRTSAERDAFAPRAGAPDPALTELKVLGGYPAARRGALGRALAMESARRQGRRSEGAALGDAIEAFCRDRGLGGAGDLKRWLDQQGIADADRFLRDEAEVRWAEILYGPDADRCLADQLRSTGEYASLCARARDKERVIAALGGSSGSLPREDLLRWYFVEHLGSSLPADLGRYARAAGFSGEEELLGAVTREHGYAHATTRASQPDRAPGR